MKARSNGTRALALLAIVFGFSVFLLPGCTYKPETDAPVAVPRSPQEVAGIVIDKVTGKPIAGVDVCVHLRYVTPNSSKRWGALDTSGLDGQFRVTANVAQTAYVTAKHKNYCKAWTAEFDIPAGSVVEDIVVEMTYGGGVTGTLTDSNGNPLSGAIIWLRGRIWADAETDRDGKYAFPHVSPGEHSIEYLSDERRSQRHFQRFCGGIPSYNEHRIKVLEGRVTKCDIQLPRVCKVSGKVYVDGELYDGSPHGEPYDIAFLKSATENANCACLYATHTYIRCCGSAPDGSYEIEVDTGEYTVYLAAGDSIFGVDEIRGSGIALSVPDADEAAIDIYLESDPEDAENE